MYYLLNFNLAPRQIWITRHGESVDNVNGRIGGDSNLSDKGVAYAKALTSFIKTQRQAWEVHQRDKALSTHFPPLPGDTTPPNPEYNHGDPDDNVSPKSFCVWTSMLKRSIQTAQFFDEEDYDTKQFKMLDELNAGTMEGLTYEEIRTKHNEEFRLRQSDKLHYRCGYIPCRFFQFSGPSLFSQFLKLPHESCLYLEDVELTPEFLQTLGQAGKDISILLIDCELLSLRVCTISSQRFYYVILFDVEKCFERKGS